MTDELCRKCGWVLGASVAACPACGATLAREGSGFETVYFPEAEASGPEGALGDLTLGTTRLRHDAGGSDPSALRLKRKPLLTRRGGHASGQRLEVACPTATVGRQGGEITIDDPTLSSRHFMIEERGHEFFLRDLGSTNGTLLNGCPVRSAQLRPGDEIKAGESVFVFSVLDVIPCD